MINDIIVPFCLYQRNEYGYIGNSIKNLQEKKYTCEFDQSYKLINTFYAINPMFRPIPDNMILFCAKKRKEFPYNTISVSSVYDPFDLEDNCVYFICYSKPVPQTIPLYLYEEEGNILPSFRNNIQGNWKSKNIIYVFNSGNTFFQKYQGRCIPGGNMELGDCVVNNMLDNSGAPPTLLQYLKKQGNDKNLETFNKNSPSNNSKETWRYALLYTILSIVIIGFFIAIFFHK